jgi:hypothetical protein
MSRLASSTTDDSLSKKSTVGQPVFFDVLGVGLVLLRSHAAVAVAALAVAAAGLRIQLHAGLAREKCK